MLVPGETCAGRQHGSKSREAGGRRPRQKVPGQSEKGREGPRAVSGLRYQGQGEAGERRGWQRGDNCPQRCPRPRACSPSTYPLEGTSQRGRPCEGGAELGEMQPRAKECGRPYKLKRRQTLPRPPPEPPEAAALPHPHSA